MVKGEPGVRELGEFELVGLFDEKASLIAPNKGSQSSPPKPPPPTHTRQKRGRDGGWELGSIILGLREGYFLEFELPG